MVFSPNTCEVDRIVVCKILGVQQVDKPDKYLDAISMGKSKIEMFGFLQDQLKQRLQTLYNKELSKHDRLTLLTSATQTMSTFWMSLLLVSASLCEEIERTMNAFVRGRAPTGKGDK